MNDRTRIAMAVVAGYYLGRRHKLRLAAALAAAGLASRMKRGEGGLLQQGTKLLGSSPELQQLTSRLRGELVEVGKAAAVAATSRQVDMLTSRLHDRAEALRKPGGAGKADEAEPDETEEYDEYDEYDEEEEPEEEPKPKPKPKPATKSAPKARRERPARPAARTPRSVR
ncbi:hypothetical protein ACFXJ8_22380 [Nonomuraea sp. NPDC059194]|uniref:hypothetical protein n=1 Tax=Nonomuraea sp. NPDC059194 TaxID=3346764 RepID=UPI0036C8C28F